MVFDILEGVADHGNAHVNQIRRGDFKHSLGELLTILVDLLEFKTDKNTVR